MKNTRKKVYNIASYLMRYKGKYRIMCEYDTRTNQFPRKLDGTYEDIDCYISCQKDIRIYHYGKQILYAYIPSIGRGKNIIKTIKKELGEGIINNIEETDSEILFRFHSKYIEQLAHYLKPRTIGASISPFSSRNLPKNKDYKMPDEELRIYKSIVENIPKERILSVTHTTNNFLKSLATRKNTWENIKADMALKGLKGKEYIHSIGKWNEYIKYLSHALADETIE